MGTLNRTPMRQFIQVGGLMLTLSGLLAGCSDSTPSCSPGMQLSADNRCVPLVTAQPDLAMPSADLATASADLAMPRADLATQSADLAMPSADLAMPSADLATANPDLAMPPKLPDLTVANIQVWPFVETKKLTLCLNKDYRRMATSPHGDQIQIKNIGSADARPYETAFGLRNLKTNAMYGASWTFNDSTGLAAGASRSWVGPVCYTFSVPAGSYRAFVQVDINSQVAESDESNNYLETIAQFKVP